MGRRRRDGTLLRQANRANAAAFGNAAGNVAVLYVGRLERRLPTMPPPHNGGRASIRRVNFRENSRRELEHSRLRGARAREKDAPQDI